MEEKNSRMLPETLTVCGRGYRVLSLLGHGKGGYSYLVTGEEGPAVLKQIHHEPCDYYQFGDKMEAEIRDYGRLTDAGIRIPKMLAADRETERILKEFVEGPTVMEWIEGGRAAGPFLPKVREMAAKAEAAGLNIDYYPTNFVISDGALVYIDYECNDYMAEWNFENWGIGYWVPGENGGSDD